MSFNPEQPFNNLPLLPPDTDFETKSILKQLANSRSALSELKGYSELLPNKNILVNTIVLKEAKNSSEIENIFTTDDELYEALAIDLKNITPETKEVLDYRSALWHGNNLMKVKNLISTNIIIEIQKVLKTTSKGIRKMPGTKIINNRTNKVIYTPPDSEKLLRDLLQNLEEYINLDSDDIDPLIKLAIIHYQFEAIHPFPDGNGRTGRILNVLYLVLKKLLDDPILYLSDYIIKTKNEYYLLLQEVTTRQNWEKWILYILKGIEETSIQTLQMIKDIKALLDSTIEKVQRELPKIYKKELIECIFYQPYTKINFIKEKLCVRRQTASDYLKQLEDIGILSSVLKGKLVVYINNELYQLLKK